MKNGYLVISLDFELLWGVFDKMDLRRNENYFLNTKKLIPQLIKMFEDKGISCTWATVGMLFNHNWDEWESNIPVRIPNYENRTLNPYAFGKSIKSVQTEKFCFAPDLVKLISQAKNQELATHTYSHYYCLEKGQTIEDFETDMIQANTIAEKIGEKLKSLVFPRNQFNSDYLKICKELNLNSIRTNPSNWYWEGVEKDNLNRKICRTLDAYLGKQDKDYTPARIEDHEGILAQKASRFLRPFSSIQILNSLRLKRILSEMEASAKKGTIYHLWWHPHNFGAYPLESIQELKIIISKFQELQNKYNYQSISMETLANSVSMG